MSQSNLAQVAKFEPIADGPRSAPIDHSAEQSVIGADLTIIGDLECAGDLRIDGRVDGDIVCRTLTLGPAPILNSKVQAEAVRVCGQFNGQIRAKNVMLSSTAKVKADIYHEVLEVEPGASFSGKVVRLDSKKAGRASNVATLKSA